MGLTVAELTADLGLNAAPFDAGLQDVLGKFGGLSPVAMAGGAAVAAGIAVGTKALVDLGESFDSAYDTIRVGTGATGDALEGLKDDFRAVFTSVPTDMETASTAVADLNTRLGLTGEPLQALSTQFINLSRITGTDLPTNISNITRVFGDWNMSADEQGGALDKLYRAAQASGIGIDQLSTSVVQSGASLRTLGFDFDESIALLAQFDKAGVNSEAVMAGLKSGIGKMAKEGESVPETFRRLMGEIEKLGPGSEATALAVEMFGTRAGNDLADAIGTGKFAIDDMMAAITDGEDTIAQAAKDTDDWRESLTRLKNKALVALEPVAVGLFNALGWLADAFVALTENEDVQAFFSELGATIAAVAEPIVWLVGVVVENWDAIKRVIGTALSVVADLIRAVMAAIRGDWGQAWTYLKRALSTAWEGMKAAVRAGVARVRDYVAELPGKIKNAVGNLGSLLKEAGRKVVTGLWDGISSMAGWLHDKVFGWASGIYGTVKSGLGKLWPFSPSKAGIDVGYFLGLGIEKGIADSLPRVSAAVSSLSGQLALSGAGGLYGVSPLYGAQTGAERPLVVEEHYHVHPPGGTALVGSAETVARLLAPSLSAQSRTAALQRRRRR